MINSVDASLCSQSSNFAVDTIDVKPHSSCSLGISNSVADHPINFGIQDKCSTLVLTHLGGVNNEQWLIYGFPYEVKISRVILQGFTENCDWCGYYQDILKKFRVYLHDEYGDIVHACNDD